MLHVFIFQVYTNKPRENLPIKFHCESALNKCEVARLDSHFHPNNQVVVNLNEKKLVQIEQDRVCFWASETFDIWKSDVFWTVRIFLQNCCDIKNVLVFIKDKVVCIISSSKLCKLLQQRWPTKRVWLVSKSCLRNQFFSLPSL